MADDSRIIPFRGKLSAAAVGEPEISVVDRHELMLEELRAELRGQLFSLNKINEQQVRTLQVHHTALVELTAVLHDLQSRTWRGRVRRLVQQLERVRVWAHGWAIELGVADPCDVTTYARHANAGGETAADANPEAMPKP